MPKYLQFKFIDTIIENLSSDKKIIRITISNIKKLPFKIKPD